MKEDCTTHSYKKRDRKPLQKHREKRVERKIPVSGSILQSKEGKDDGYSELCRYLMKGIEGLENI